MSKRPMKFKGLTYWPRFRRRLVKGKRVVTALLALMAVVAAAVGNWTTLQQWWVSHFGEDDTTLIVRRARLIPYFVGFPSSSDRDQFSLQLELRNYGASSVILTSADIAIVDALDAKIGPGGSVPSDRGCTLSSALNENEPIELSSGESAWIEISPMVNWPGIHRWLDSDKLAAVHALPDNFLTIYELKVVDDLNTELARRFGPNAKIVVTLFSNIHTKRRTLTFYLARGKNLLAKDGSLMQDALISYWLSPNAKALGLDCRKPSKL